MGRFGFAAHRVIPWFGWIAPVLMVVFWAAVVTAVVFLIRFLVKQSRQGSGGKLDAALDIVRNRYAKGEITKEQYEEMQKTLS
jgi:putative membrane protein